MNSTTHGNAMTEVALALAMAFFSLMVLTLVSMGTPQVKKSVQMPSATASTKISLALTSEKIAPDETATKAPTLVIFWQGAFLDRNLQPFPLATQELEGRVILALPPDLPMGRALNARAQLKTGNIVVSALNESWLTRLRGMRQ